MINKYTANLATHYNNMKTEKYELNAESDNVYFRMRSLLSIDLCVEYRIVRDSIQLFIVLMLNRIAV